MPGGAHSVTKQQKVAHATENSKHYHVPFGNDASLVNHSGVAAIKSQQFFQNSSSTLARLARYLSTFTLMCRKDTAGRGALESPPEGGAHSKLYSTEKSSSANRILRPRQKTPDQNTWHQGMILCIYILYSIGNSISFSAKFVLEQQYGNLGRQTCNRGRRIFGS